MNRFKRIVTVNPWGELWAYRLVQGHKHRDEGMRNADDVLDGVRRTRQKYLGSDIRLEPFVRQGGRPMEEAVVSLSEWLGERTEAFLDYEGQYDLCVGFYYYSLQLYAHGRVGGDTVDDLLQLAEVYEKDSEVLCIIAEDNLPAELADETRYFYMENEQTPPNFWRAVLGALAVFLGVIPDPVETEES